MVRDVLVAAGMTMAVFAAVLGLLAVVFRAQVRRYNRVVAADVLSDWTARLELLDPAHREGVVPPANVLAAMVALPGPGLRAGWTEKPMRAPSPSPGQLT